MANSSSSINCRYDNLLLFGEVAQCFWTSKSCHSHLSATLHFLCRPYIHRCPLNKAFYGIMVCASTVMCAPSHALARLISSVFDAFACGRRIYVRF